MIITVMNPMTNLPLTNTTFQVRIHDNVNDHDVVGGFFLLTTNHRGKAELHDKFIDHYIAAQIDGVVNSKHALLIDELVWVVNTIPPEHSRATTGPSLLASCLYSPFNPVPKNPITRPENPITPEMLCEARSHFQLFQGQAQTQAQAQALDHGGPVKASSMTR